MNLHVFYFVVERLRFFGTEYICFPPFFAAVLTAICVFAYSHSVSFRERPLVRLWYSGVQACAEPALNFLHTLRGFPKRGQITIFVLDMPAKMATTGVFFFLPRLRREPCELSCNAYTEKAGLANGVSSFQFQCFCLMRPSFWIAILIAVSAEQHGRGTGTCTIVRCALFGERAHSNDYYRSGAVALGDGHF